MNPTPVMFPRSHRTVILLTVISALACGASTVTDGSSLSPEPASEMGSDPAPSGDAPAGDPEDERESGD